MDGSRLRGQRLLGLWGFWKEWRRVSHTTSLGLGLQQREGGAWDPLVGGAGAPSHRRKGCALKMKGRRVWEEEGRQKPGATGEGGGGGGRHLGEHLARTGRRLAVREQAWGFQPTLMTQKEWNKGSPSFLQLLTYGASHKGASSLGNTQQHGGGEGGECV